MLSGPVSLCLVELDWSRHFGDVELIWREFGNRKKAKVLQICFPFLRVLWCI